MSCNATFSPVCIEGPLKVRYSGCLFFFTTRENINLFSTFICTCLVLYLKIMPIEACNIVKTRAMFIYGIHDGLLSIFGICDSNLNRDISCSCQYILIAFIVATIAYFSI